MSSLHLGRLSHPAIEPRPRGRGSVRWTTSVVAVTLLAQVHALLQRLTGVLSLFAHADHSFVMSRCLRGGARALLGEPMSADVAGSPRRGC
ncbi:hypothetical protein BN12_660009 [Nostocoides japonicum T1-X7]|uniref:Uncharacterized protein n=1 Tax=Nostocoides japonicum T1-X7 TaxID=1194083 RepID=A0A077M6Z8_9MICO|nr:hypothetical protein BN12_660009 [Tetrasphaera japonica T1-X7]